MKQLAVITFVCLFQISLSQQGQNYIKLMNDLVLVDSSLINESFKDGKLKHTGILKHYKFNEYVYEMNVGEHIRYYKDGSKTVSMYDDWGTNLINSYYDSEGHLIMEYITTKIETADENLQDFLNSNKKTTYNVSFKDYRYDYKECKYYLKKEGRYSNGKKTGIWKYYLSTGNLQKEKNYN